MAQVIVLDFGTGKATVFTYNETIFDDLDNLLQELVDDEKLSSIENCQWMQKEDEIEIEYETI
jgi:alpha-glucosidase (family GH31 glycosyl hydrolase)